MTLGPVATDNPAKTKSSYNAASYLLNRASFAILKERTEESIMEDIVSSVLVHAE
jgi:hypothetical protein